MEFTKENFDKALLEKEKAEQNAAQFKKEAEDAKAEVATLISEKKQAETFAQVSEQIEAFAKNGKIAFSNDEDKEAAKKFAASLPDEEARKTYFATLTKLVAVKDAEKQFGADDGGEDEGGEKTDAEKQEAEAEKVADEFMKAWTFTNRGDALAEAYKKLGIVE